MLRKFWGIVPITAQGPHAGKFSVKYKDDPNWWTHSLLREGYGKDKHWVLLGLAHCRDDVVYWYLIQ